MSKLTVVNPWHWLNEDASFPDNVRGRAIRVAQCIEYGGSLRRGHGRQTLIACRRRPDGSPCPGLMFVLKQSDDAILAFCEVCNEEEFLIYEWEDTPWAKGQQPPIDPERELGVELHDPPEPGPDKRDEQLRRALVLVGSSMRAAEVRECVATANSPTEVLQAIIDSCMTRPEPSTIERLLPVLLQVWNETPRPELGGRSPTDVHRAGVASNRKIGRNAPCPCGSGRKYKHCCLDQQRH